MYRFKIYFKSFPNRYSLNVDLDIMYNVDQQMFDYCTAKFSDNTQCCIPVFDIRHELPLCPEHAAKAVSALVILYIKKVVERNAIFLDIFSVHCVLSCMKITI